MVEIKSYTEWIPQISPEDVFADITMIYKQCFRNNVLYWGELRPSEGGRIVIVRKQPGCEPEDLTPANFSVRSRVHEYGGVAWIVDEKFLYFVNHADQRLYKQDLANILDIIPLTSEKNIDGSLGKYAAFCLSRDSSFLICVYEKEFSNRENLNYLVLLDLTVNAIQEPKILHEGYDFYGDPILSPDGTKIAWISWNHPNMPWDDTILAIAELTDKEIRNFQIIISTPGVCANYPIFSPKNQLFFVMDEVGYPMSDYRNWWNIYKWENGKIHPITKELREFGAPMWKLGNLLYYFRGETKIIAMSTHKGSKSLNLIDLSTQNIEQVALPLKNLELGYSSASNSIVLSGSSAYQPQILYLYDLPTKKLSKIVETQQSLLAKEEISEAILIEFPTEMGHSAFGHLYLPLNCNYIAPESENPPLIMNVHGGPTGAAIQCYQASRLFWNSAGFAIFDIGYHESTGYGRKFRESLKKAWGIIDIKDIRDNISYLSANNYINKSQCFISGGSSGGYSVQRAMTLFPDLFLAGASYFGIGNLITLAKMTHKFESRYLDTLMGGTLESAPEIFHERSPINSISQLKSPMILFQGAKDKMVPPEISREMVKILNEKNIYNEYVEYPNEGHGFRDKNNIIDCFTKEMAFFKKVMKNEEK